mgnify:CR=1 FL=1
MARIAQPEAFTGMKPAPFSFDCFVNWGDCDPAGVIFTPRVFDFFMRALEAWYVEFLGHDFFAMQNAWGFGSPTVRTGCEYLKVLRAGQAFRLELRVKEVGAASIRFIGEALDGTEAPCFRIDHTVCSIEPGTFQPKRFPPEVRRRIVDYQTSCGDGGNPENGVET